MKTHTNLTNEITGRTHYDNESIHPLVWIATSMLLTLFFLTLLSALADAIFGVERVTEWWASLIY